MHLTIRRLVSVVVMAALVATGTAAVASPAGAAVPDPVYIQTVNGRHCLQQIYVGGAPSVWVNMIHPCGNTTAQQWGVHRVSNNRYVVVNHKSGWCLSHPNPEENSLIYAEICTGANKQVWILDAIAGGAFFINDNTRYYMAHMGNDQLRGVGFLNSARDLWRWSTIPAN